MALKVDYLISAVCYQETDNSKFITSARVHDYANGKVYGHTEWSRERIVSSIEDGKVFYTTHLKDNKWVWGEEVHVIEVKGKKYIRTDPNPKEEDNLGKLPSSC